MFDWNDLRYFLAVARTGSTLGASRALAVNPTTVARRIAELERAIGMKLFDKRQTGYALTEAGAELRATAERVELEATAFAEGVAAIGRRISGVIRVTTNEGLANGVMAPALSAFRRLHPDVRIDLIVDERRLDLARGAADVALRTGSRPTVSLGGGSPRWLGPFIAAAATWIAPFARTTSGGTRWLGQRARSRRCRAGSGSRQPCPRRTWWCARAR